MAVAGAVTDVMAEHTTLEVECVNRLYLNVYVTLRQTGGASASCTRSAANRCPACGAS